MVRHLTETVPDPSTFRHNRRRTQSQCRCGRGGPRPDADVQGASPVPVQMWDSIPPANDWPHGRRRARRMCVHAWSCVAAAFNNMRGIRICMLHACESASLRMDKLTEAITRKCGTFLHTHIHTHVRVIHKHVRVHAHPWSVAHTCTRTHMHARTRACTCTLPAHAQDHTLGVLCSQEFFTILSRHRQALQRSSPDAASAPPTAQGAHATAAGVCARALSTGCVACGCTSVRERACLRLRACTCV
jgi:hypothetical protein